jgi:mannose-6-phosphate isomerase-like protein (cupin superfamily)
VPIVDSSELGVHEPLPGWKGRFFNSESMTFVYYELAPDAVPLHEHHHEQEEVWHVIEGSINLSVDGVEHVVEAGSAAVVPSNTRHSARVTTACRAIVVDTPRRTSIGGIVIDDIV